MSSMITNEISSGVSSMKQFITDNNIVGTCAGVCVGLAAKDSINSLVEDVLSPLILISLHGLNIDWITNYLPVNGNSQLNIFKFIKNLSTFFIVIIVSFLFVYVAFFALLGVNSKAASPSSTSSPSSPSSTSSPSSPSSTSSPPSSSSSSSNTTQTNNIDSTINQTSSDLFTTIGGMNGSKYSLRENFDNYLAYSNN